MVYGRVGLPFEVDSGIDGEGVGETSVSRIDYSADLGMNIYYDACYSVGSSETNF